MAIFSAIASVGGALFGSSAAKKAASTQAEASDRASILQAETAERGLALQEEMYETTRGDLAPWRQTGEVALTELADLYGLPVEGRPVGEDGGTRDERKEAAMDRFFTSPGYEFRLGEGIRAIERKASSRGRLGSGALGRELTRYGQGVASQEFGSYANRLASFAGAGQSAAGMTGNIGMQVATNQGNILQASAANQGQLIANAGTARASGYTGSAEAITGGIRDLAYVGSRYSGWGGGSSVQRPTMPDPNWGF